MVSRAARVNTPTGDTWHVRTYRVRLPAWRQIDFGDDPLNGRDLPAMLLALVSLPFTLLLFPLLFFVAGLPRAVLAAWRSDDAWVEAARYWPTEERYLWRTSRDDVPAVRAAVIEMLSAGRHVSVARADLVDHTEVVNY
jgi:hypothetical protein